ncbi:flagellar protein FlgN [Bacillus luteolus]|uniref:Flagellar protein FlgN n=1 Tax=Litchfieldia luteola TaxID=682179 RepID=A0ABR9QEY7_9BACI|nr:flagellar protein FlgN [Cytobacillus luteolus]MBE4907056.1 flagellar protein FlgN [Cytobacillus luteolus]MBP1943477.1 hypothetical protein [Cytobacillus luteolus]
MSTEQLVKTLQKLAVLHEHLLTIAKQKSDILKNGDIDALNQQMKEEQKYVLAIKQIENERIMQVQHLLENYRLRDEEYTLTKVIEISKEPFKQRLIDIQQKLVYILDELKQVNALNQQLTHQSLQFVNVTLDMLRPEITTTNYGHPEKKQKDEHSNRSMFDSKA